MKILCYLIGIVVLDISVASSHGKYTGVYSTFPKFKALPLEMTDAIRDGYIQQKECSSADDEYGAIYSKTESRFLPGLIYNTHGQLSGMVFGVNKTDLLRPDDDFAPFWYEETRGQVYWFRDPSTICDPDSSSTDTIADGIWIKMPNGQIFKLPEQPEYPEIGYNTASHWTEHLCVVGMGTHFQYGECDSQYQFTALYDAKDSLVGVVNAVNLNAAMEDEPELIEIIPSANLMGLVFNETRFDPCYNLAQPRIFIHVYLQKPELEYQSCNRPTAFTPMNDQTKRCILCATALKSILGTTCQGDTTSATCCCEMFSLSNQDGGCEDQGCVLPSSCDEYDTNECTSSSTSIAAMWTVLIMFLLLASWLIY